MTLIPFTPSNNASPPFSTQVTLDNTSYTFSAAWNISGQRYFASITDQSGANIWTGALIGSPLDYDILLAPGIFGTSTILYRADTRNLEVNP
ncbi:phage baseplate plug family protein [Paraburkholderia dilworthii]|uniref:phage baseplate plug family protein n=1 Tax=Paraburkholderia dilworthii TaxID=948106 RepID=UPI00041FA3B3|nr:hypothetical protein [Paraburkholderia dilworthii]